jgi:hypothetical protein
MELDRVASREENDYFLVLVLLEEREQQQKPHLAAELARDGTMRCGTIEPT